MRTSRHPLPDLISCKAKDGAIPWESRHDPSTIAADRYIWFDGGTIGLTASQLEVWLSPGCETKLLHMAAQDARLFTAIKAMLDEEAHPAARRERPMPEMRPADSLDMPSSPRRQPCRP